MNSAGKTQSFLMLNPLEHVVTNGFKMWNENEKADEQVLHL
jgi:hypothetical protein